MDTIKTNKEIAKFLGLTHKATKGGFMIKGIVVKYEKLNFHNDWNSLMEVVEKIESLGYKINNFSINNYIYIGKDDVASVIINEPNLTKKEAFYQAVVKFVNWYNEQNKQNFKTK